MFFYRAKIFIDFKERKFVEPILMNNQECKVRPQIVNVNGDDPVFVSFSIKTSKCSGSCNNINNPWANLCLSDAVKNLNVKVFNLVTGTNETWRIEWHETCKGKCRFNGSVCNVNNVGMMTNAGVNTKNWLIQAYAIKDLFGILVILSMYENVINPVILVSI